MNFLFPGALAFAALVPLIVLWYLRRPRRRPLEVSTLMFWQRILEREPHRKFLGKLRHPLSLLLQLVIFLLLLLALARPEGRPHGHRSTVVVLDARARMQADGGRVFRDAVNAASAAASRAAADDEVAVLAVEGAPRIVSPFAADGKALRERLAAVPVSDASGGLEETLA
ncbi:MAG TPA: BatA domain-containing protein, partial [Terrimicrobiaceae bacterium]|nr:BatA domain-containing protein [Terrimicrobiaceae bacterium]